MSRDAIRSATRLANSIVGETWQYRQRTGNLKGSTSDAYTSWTDVTANYTVGNWRLEYDPDRDTDHRVETANWRISDETVPLLVIGDQVKGPDGVVWAVVELVSSAAGTRRYRIQRDAPVLSQGDRKGRP